MDDLPETLLDIGFQAFVATGNQPTDFGGPVMMYPQDCYTLWHFMDGVASIGPGLEGPWTALQIDGVYLTHPGEGSLISIPQGCRFARLVFSVVAGQRRRPAQSTQHNKVRLPTMQQPDSGDLFGFRLPFLVPAALQEHGRAVLEHGCAIWWRSVLERYEASHLVQAWLLRLVRYQLEQQATDDSEVDLIDRMENIVSEYLSRGIEAQELARRVGLSQRQLQRVVQASCGKTPGAFIKAIRGREACRLLTMPELTVANVAERCGFASSGTFCRWFRGQFACSPGEWRQDRLVAASARAGDGALTSASLRDLPKA